MCVNSTFAKNWTCINGSCNTTEYLCDDNNSCTLDSCDNVKGCDYISQVAKCDNNDKCYTYSCDTATGNCSYNFLCSNLTDFCGTGICDNNTKTCVYQPRKCPKKNNCTTATCVSNATFKGCINKTYDCINNLAGIIGATISAGVIAGIVVALAILCGLICTGGAYAVVQTVGAGTEQSVFVNPLHVAAGTEQQNPLFANL